MWLRLSNTVQTTYAKVGFQEPIEPFGSLAARIREMTIEERRVSEISEVDHPPATPPNDLAGSPATEAVNDVLRQWRAAERSLAKLHPGSEEWAATVRQISRLRGRYQELFRSASPRDDGDSQIPA